MLYPSHFVIWFIQEIARNYKFSIFLKKRIINGLLWTVVFSYVFFTLVITSINYGEIKGYYVASTSIRHKDLENEEILKFYNINQ